MNSETQSLVPATQQAESVELTIEQVRENLSVTEKGQPANTIGNCRTVFCQDPLLRGAIRLNLLTDRVDIVRDLGWRRSTSALTDTDVKYLLLYFEQNYGLTSEKKLMAALSIVANENCYHPIVLLSKTQWTLRYHLYAVSSNFKIILSFCFVRCQDVSFLLWSNCGQPTLTNDHSPLLSYMAQFRFSKIEIALFCLHELFIRRICQPCQ